MTKIALVVIGDGREEYLRETVLAAQANLPYANMSPHIMVNDSGDMPYGDRLSKTYTDFNVVSHSERRGLAAAVQTGWRKALESNADYLFHLEEDFIIKFPVQMDQLIRAFSVDPDLCQIVLRRQPWNDEERAQGDLCGDDPRYIQREAWIEHNVIFSLNPSLIPRPVIELGWPAGNEAEMTERVNALGMKMAWWGRKDDVPDVEHIGINRGAGWKL